MSLGHEGTGTLGLCAICGEPLDEGADRPVQYGLDGQAAHHDCLELDIHDDEEEER